MSKTSHPGEVSDHPECPLCMEPFELDDMSFFPCTCGYQICRFCWHRIRTDESGLCPACRKPYSENPAEYTPLTVEQVQKMKGKKKQKVQDRKQKVLESRKNLADVRVVQRNLVFVIGLSPRLADPEVLKRQEYFGKFGKIVKVVINNHTVYSGQQGPSVGAYITYSRREEAVKAIQAVNSAYIDGRYLKASFGTTKYCTFFLRGTQCSKPDCMYLHELGEEEASFTKEDMQQGKHQLYESAQLANIVTQKEPPPPAASKKPLPSVQGGGGSKRTPLLPAPIIPLADTVSSDPDSALPASAQWAQKMASSVPLSSESRSLTDPAKGRSAKDKTGKTSKRGARKQATSPRLDGGKPHNQKPGQAHSTAPSEGGRPPDSVQSTMVRGGDALDVISEPSSSPVSSLLSSPKSMARSVESLDDPSLERPPSLSHEDAEREREEETEGAVVSSSVLQRAGSALQSAPPLLQGEERANGAAVDEDEEEDSLSVLGGLHLFGSLGVAWTGTGAPCFERQQGKEATTTTATQRSTALQQGRGTSRSEVFQSSVIPSLTLQNPAVGGAETGDVSKILTQFNKEEEEEKQRRASESYVAFGPTTNECDSKGRPEGRRRGGKQQGSSGLSQLWGGRDLGANQQGWQDGFKALLPGVNVNFGGGGLLSASTGGSAWQATTPLDGFGQVTSHDLGRSPKTSSANEWPDVFGDSPPPKSGLGGTLSEKKPKNDRVESKKQTSETSKAASRPPPGFSASHKEHLPMTDSVWGPAEQHSLSMPAMPWPTAAIQPQFKPPGTRPVAAASTGLLFPSAPPPHAYLIPQQPPVYAPHLIWGGFAMPSTTTTGSLHQQYPSQLLPSVPGAVGTPASYAPQRTSGQADTASPVVHKDENTGQISQKASSRQ